MDPRGGLPAVKMTCPYTTQNCPLFAPSFSLESVQPVSHLPTARKDVEQPQKQSPESDGQRQQHQQQTSHQQYSALPPIRPRAELPDARSSAETTQQSSRQHQQEMPSLRLPSFDYSDYSLAPSPSPSASPSSSSAPAHRRPSISYVSQPRQLPPYTPQQYPPYPLEQQRPQAGPSTSAASLQRGSPEGESAATTWRGAGGEGEGSSGRHENGGGRRYSLLHIGGEGAPVVEQGGARASSAMREEQEQGQRWGPGQWGRLGEEHHGEGQGVGQRTPSGSGSASLAASPSLSGEEEAVAESPHSEMVTPFISKLVHLLSQREFREVIRWTDAGDAFVFAHTSPVLLGVFARFFRHSNVHSFVRQLNIYDFQRLSTLALLEAIQTTTLPPSSAPISASDYSAFTHPLFWRDGALNRPPCDLTKIKPKATKGKAAGSKKASASGGAKRKTLGTKGEKAGGVRSRVDV